jgi:hypothetical protein
MAPVSSHEIGDHGVFVEAGELRSGNLAMPQT